LPTPWCGSCRTKPAMSPATLCRLMAGCVPCEVARHRLRHKASFSSLHQNRGEDANRGKSIRERYFRWQRVHRSRRGLMNANGCWTLLSRSLSSRTYRIFQARRSTVGKRPQADRATDVLVPMQYQQARSVPCSPKSETRSGSPPLHRLR
jgi:hypothetical protein